MDYREQPPRQTTYRFSGGSQTPPVLKTLIIVNIAVFAFQYLAAAFGGPDAYEQIAHLGGVYVPYVLKGAIYQFVTYAFMHGGAMHILFNMLFFWMFGREVAQVFGRKRFIAFYLTAAAFSGVAYFLFDLGLIFGRYEGRLSEASPCIGASGVVMAVMMVYALYWPNRIVLFMLIIPMRIRTFITIIVIFEALAVLNIFEQGNVANIAHLGGLLWGLIFVRHWPQLESAWARWTARRGPSSGPRGGRVYGPGGEGPEDTPSTKHAEKLDAILDKIHREGITSLTRRERRFLEKMSKRR
jgi:membrane associated rhomboid family serine protease